MLFHFGSIIYIFTDRDVIRVIQFSKIVNTVDAHTAGEPVRVITSGLPKIPGVTMLAKMNWFEENLADVRNFLMREPRGHRDMFGAVLTPPVTQDGDVGVLYMHTTGQATMCGHLTIGTVKVIVETGMIPSCEGENIVRIDSPAGRITATATVKNGKVSEVSFQNVPSFLYADNIKVDIPGIGSTNVAVSYGGDFYIFVEAADLGVQVTPEYSGEILRYTKWLKGWGNSELKVIHPEAPGIEGIYGVIVTDSVERTPQGWKSRETASCHPGALDRSPCGTGTSARMALLYARGLMDSGQILENYSIVNTMFICSVVSLATGTSWGTIGTIGLSLLGISLGLGIPAPMVVGAVVSGSYFGDKMSPLSDTTILAPAVAGTDLFLHIRAMMWTTGPSCVIVSAILIYLGFGFADGTLETVKIQAIMKIMEAEFWISPVTLLVPVTVIVLSAMRKPALPSLWTGVFMALAMMVFQGKSITEIFNSIQWGYTAQFSKELLAGAESPEVLVKFIADSGLNLAFEVITGAAKDIVKLVSRGGMQSMNWTASLMVIALVFGSAMEACGFFTAVVEAIIKRVKTVPGMITATGISSVLGNAFLGDAYLAIVVPGRIFKPAFEKMGLHPRMLSRTLEDFGTLTAGLIPWCTGGVFIAGTLGVPTLEYLPYAHLLWVNPLAAIIITYMGIGIFWSGKDGESVKGGKTRPAELMEK